MESLYRQTAAVKGRRASEPARRNVDRKRLIQLTVSLLLFGVVFAGRELCPDLSDMLERVITEDFALSEVFSNEESKHQEDENIFTGLKQWIDSTFGMEHSTEPPQLSAVPEQNAQNEIEIIPLSQTQMHGLLYDRERLGRGHEDDSQSVSKKSEQSAEKRVVTAVAQAYNEKGEKLPRNVSYERYELGLNQTVDPVNGEITSGFEYRTSPISGEKEFHLALDIAAPKGTEVAAFADGVVRYIGENDDFGLYLMIDHDYGVATFYAHCSKLLVRKGDRVSCGDTVALVGNTGNATGYHLHFTIEKDNIRLNPAYYVQQKQ